MNFLVFSLNLNAENYVHSLFFGSKLAGATICIQKNWVWMYLQVIQYPSRTKLPDFVLSEIRWAKHQFIYAAGPWDQLTVNFFLTRQFGVYIIQMYFPVETVGN